MLLKVRQKQFELGDKPDKLLSRQLRGLQASRAIHKIKNKEGVFLTNPSEINDTFKDFYEELYKSKGCSDPSLLTNFLHSLQLPKLGCSEQAALNADITVEEILDAIKSFPSGKASGPDGFGIEFYKRFAQTLSPLLLRMFNHSFGELKLPQSFYEANISLILKKGKEETDPSSYRPIALLNSDLKIFTKILANRLNNYIKKYSSFFQSGFIPGHFSFLMSDN